ncbi:fungal-specific transcription factor domain-containing protein [Pseudomassariella vexata]|uniref:Fungal-specific transcription factor domain-domain-containing protein n=1 Tax=Pseudomassariella vexata TaxID=1141098 RepID=A0A1Y2E1X8_9PEZI|nr:fungal-specific transcription factor domain-containing protein [Pseudomassariella vexata]ORY65551.1 fungal-specific transcription factor domain-domain-containing protein [Pseudomassariella vexata]
MPPPRPRSSRRQNRPRVAEDARLRAKRACVGCRRLKEKCDGHEPCSRCLRCGRDCQFSTIAVAASAPSSSRATAAAAAAAPPSKVGDANETERVQCLERLVTHFLGDIPLDVNNLRRITERLKTGPGSNNATGYIDWEDLEGLTLEDESFTVKTLSPGTAHYSGEFSHWNFSQRIRQQLDQRLDHNQSAIQWQGLNEPPASVPVNDSMRGTMKVLEYWRATQLQSPNSHVMDALNCLPPRRVAEFLAHIYFQFAQVNCFFVEEGWLREKLAALYEGSNPTSADSAWVCAVIMVLGIGTQFAHMATGPSKSPPIIKNGKDSELVSEPDVSLTFYQMAARLIPDIIAIASLDSVQACLLLAHYSLPLDTQGLAYTYLGLAVKMAIQNGMHRRYTGNDLDASTVENRNRLWWTAYTMEKRVSILHGRPASITSTEIDVQLPRDLPEFRQYEDPSKFPNMSAMIYMTQRLGDISTAVTLLRRCPKALQPTYFERVLDVCQKLKTWWLTLPPDVQTPNPISPLFRSNSHLKLCFHINDIFVGRPFIFHDSKQASPRAMRDQPSANPGRSSSRASLVSGAVAAAFEVIELLGSLQDTIGLARASYTEFSSCRAALLVMLAQSLNERTERLGAMIEMGMRIIKSMAAGSNVSARSETSVIIALELAVRRLYKDGDGNPGVASVSVNEDTVDNQRSGYERFKEWASLCKGATLPPSARSPIYRSFTPAGFTQYQFMAAIRGGCP